MDELELQEAWTAITERVKTYPEIDASQINAFFPRLEIQAMSSDFAMLTAATDFIKTWIERHYIEVIKRAFSELYGDPFTVMIEVDPSQEARMIQIAQAAAQAQVQAQTSLSNAAPVVQQQAPAPVDPTPMSITIENPSRVVQAVLTDDQEPVDILNPTSALTFENFVIGNSNNYAYNMAVAVAEAPGKQTYNPLFIYGKSGLGKTHLLRAIQNYIHTTLPHYNAIYADSAELLSEYMEASTAHDKEKSSFKNFKKKYENADVLLIDDVQFLQGKKQTLDIVFQIFNTLINQGKQIVLSADRAPKNIDVDERYQSRFNSGVTIDIQPPELETKLGIIRNFINKYRENENKPNFTIPDDVQMFIAETAGSNIRELKSAVTKVIFHMETSKLDHIELVDVRDMLENHFSSTVSKRLTVEEIQKEVENFYKVSHADLVGKKRSRNIIHARQIGIYLCRKMIDLPFNDIGKKFNRDHSTVMYSVQNVEDKMKKSRDMKEEIEALIQIIKEI